MPSQDRPLELPTMGTTVTETPIVEGVKCRTPKADYWTAGAILGLCCAAANVRWLKIDSLIWGDPARWLLEAYRVSAGDIPYRDFTWVYSPFSLFLFGWSMK